MKEVLGVDVGGVILDWVRTKGTDVDFSSDNYLLTPPIDGAIESLVELNKGRFKDSVFFVSRYAYHGPGRVREWLTHHEIYRKTGIPESHLFQCAKREDKAPICADLHVTHFVDDRAEVLSHLTPAVPNLYLFQALDEEKELARKYPHIRFFESWERLLKELR